MAARVVATCRYAGLACSACDPSVFAPTYEGFGNQQIALFAAFGGFAS